MWAVAVKNSIDKLLNAFTVTGHKDSLILRACTRVANYNHLQIMINDFSRPRLAYCDAQLPPKNLREFVPRLNPILLSNMAYAEDDESLLDAEEDGSNTDRDQHLRPHFHSSRFHGFEDGEDDDDDIVNIWNLRKCSAAALDVLSNVFGDEILPTLMPVVQLKASTHQGLDQQLPSFNLPAKILSASGDAESFNLKCKVYRGGAESSLACTNVYCNINDIIDDRENKCL